MTSGFSLKKTSYGDLPLNAVGVIFLIVTACAAASAQNDFGKPESMRSARVLSPIVLFVRSATPLLSGEYAGDGSCLIPWFSKEDCTSVRVAAGKVLNTLAILGKTGRVLSKDEARKT